MLKKFYRFSYVTGMILIIVSMMLSLNSTDPALAAGNPGTLWTTTVACGLDPVDSNHFAVGENIYLHLRGFEPNTSQDWSITGTPGSCDSQIAVASGTANFDANGDACFLAYTVLPNDCGTYQVKVGTKGDNYRVDEAEPPVALSMDVTKSPNPSSVPYTGGDVTFTITVMNTGNRDLTITSVDDSIYGAVCTSLLGTILAPGASVSCSFTETVTGDPGSSHTNVYSVDAEWETQTVSASGSATVTVGNLPPIEGSLQKSANPVSIEPGGLVTFSVLITNGSTEEITLDTLEDNVFGNITTTGHDGITQTTCATGGTIAPSGSYSCSFTAVVDGTVGGQHVDTITAGVSMTNGQTATWQDSATVTFVQGPALSLNVTKVPSLNSVQEPGGNVTFAITVENTSNVEVTLTSLTDSDFDLGTVGTCSVPQTLAVGASYNCEVTAYISAAHENTVTATISYPGEDDVTGSATAVVGFTQKPDPTITVVKSANPTVMDVPGGPVVFTIDITNTSPDITVRIDDISDTIFGDLTNGDADDGTCPGLLGLTIAPLASRSCSFTRDVTGDNAFVHVNTVFVTVYDVDLVDNRVTGQDDATVTVNDLPKISVSKVATPTSIGEYGGDVTFTITVNNQSVEPLQLNSLTDTVFGDLDGRGDCSIPQDLAVGGSYSCSFSAPLQGDFGADHENVVTATAVDSDQNEAFDSDNAIVVFTDQLPTITVTKSALPAIVDETGEQVTFTVQVTNTSGEPVTLLSVSDSVFDGLGCSLDTINPGQTYTCEFTRLVSGDVGTPHINEVTAVAEDDEGNSAQNSDTAEVNFQNVQAVIQVTKEASVSQVLEPGEDVEFTVTVDNLVNEQITLINLVDDIYNDITTTGHDGISATTCATGGVIAGLGNYSCKFTAPVNGNAGFIHINTVTATAQDNDGGDPVQDSDSARVDVVDALPIIQVTKTAAPTSVPAPNATVSFTVDVFNDSFETVTLIELVDDQFGNLSGRGDCAIDVDIEAGKTYSCTFEATISGQSGDTHTNVVTATVVDNDGSESSDFDDANVRFTAPPKLVLADPCSVGCDQPDVTGQICNQSSVDDYNGTITWDTYLDDTRIGGGSISGVPAGECVDLSTARQGNGLYSITVTFVDENGRTLKTSCGPLSCQAPVNPTPIPPVVPPTGTGPLIPVTGFDFSQSGTIATVQNFGIALIAFGLVLHGFSLNGKNKRETE